MSLSPCSNLDKVVVLFHSHCADGISSAAVTRRFLSKVLPAVPSLFFPVSYGPAFARVYTEKVKPVLTKNTLVVAVDVSLAYSDILEISENVQEFVEIDHHDSTEKNVLSHFAFVGDSESSYGYIETFASKNMTLYYSNAACGAMHCQSVLHPLDDMPEYLRYIDDRDRWVWALPNSKEVSSAIFVALNGLNVPKCDGTDPASFQQAVCSLIDHADILLDTFDVASLSSSGAILLAQEEQLMLPLLNHPITVWLEAPDGERLECFGVNSGIFQSELGNKVATPVKPAAIFNYTRDGWSISLRAHADYEKPLNVFAQKFQGGGHPKACGLKIPTAGFDGTLFKLPT